MASFKSVDVDVGGSKYINVYKSLVWKDHPLNGDHATIGNDGDFVESFVKN